ncbi:helix-turn-helix domain-containing protein [Rugosimonospora africana]|uniref:Helix-turn-helix domain-containing protein n=1 Tax=Rugosimonospora africana TaxID=556532 RepID=A0A8J3QZM8_9ACTN|nr:helix-turn-helix domain-containing protein [Rugosimonospora africana]GIH19169.1 hypothetical protein Raf01_73410 [Rugosimonospora africana]
MTGPTPAHPAFHRAADVAEILHCSEWWVKQQARQRRIPFCWIGGSYRFTDEHVTQIARLFEVPATDPATPAAPRRESRPPADADGAPVVQLVARQPRRVRAAAQTAA